MTWEEEPIQPAEDDDGSTTLPLEANEPEVAPAASKAKNPPPENIETFADALDYAEPRPPADGDAGDKRTYGTRLSNALALLVADKLRADFPGILPTQDGKGTESRARVARGYKKLDVNYSTLQTGLGLGVSIKTINYRDPTTQRYTKNYSRNDNELRAEASDYHRRQPFSVLAALLFVPADAAEDAGKAKAWRGRRRGLVVRRMRASTSAREAAGAKSTKTLSGSNGSSSASTGTTARSAGRSAASTSRTRLQRRASRGPRDALARGGRGRDSRYLRPPQHRPSLRVGRVTPRQPRRTRVDKVPQMPPSPPSEETRRRMRATRQRDTPAETRASASSPRARPSLSRRLPGPRTPPRGRRRSLGTGSPCSSTAASGTAVPVHGTAPKSNSDWWRTNSRPTSDVTRTPTGA